MKSILITAFILAAFNTNASILDNRVGNGGDVVICSTKNGTLYSVLDQFEDVELRYAVTQDEGLSFEQETVHLIERLKTVNPVRYQAYMDTFYWINNTVTFSSADLADAEDAGETDIYYQNPYPATHCSLEQAALFSKTLDSITGRFEYIINKNIWMQLTAKQKAVLLLHEIIYTEAVLLGFNDSEIVRQINRIILKNDVEQLSQIDSLLASQVKDSSLTYGGFKRAMASSLSSNISSALIQSTIDTYKNKKFCGRKNLYRILDAAQSKFNLSKKVGTSRSK